jgi:glycosyltransferase involved in cell wall biosynthesis
LVTAMKAPLARSDRPIGILYVIDTCICPGSSRGGHPGGAEKQLYMLATSLNKELFRPVVVQLGAGGAETATRGTAEGAEFLHLPLGRLYGPQGVRGLRHLRKLARERRVNIIHTFFEKADVAGWLTARSAGNALWVSSRRDLGFKKKGIYKAFSRLTASDCAACVAVCRAVRDQVVKDNELPKEKMTVIYNGLEPLQSRDPQAGKALREELGVQGNAPLVGMVANFNFHIKGHKHFLHAAREVTRKMPEVHFVLVGDGPLRVSFQAMVQEMGIGKRVHFLGTRRDVPTILSGLTVSVLCSTSEGLSNVVLESMAAAIPVVATNVGGNAELVTDRVTGYLVPPADAGALAEAVMEALANPRESRDMALRARLRAEKEFNVQAMVQKYERLYMSLMGVSSCMKEEPCHL